MPSPATRRKAATTLVVATPPATADPLRALLPKARRHWAKTDPPLAALARQHPFEARAIDGQDGFTVLVGSILAQQVSLAAGRTIQGRLVEAAGGYEPGSGRNGVGGRLRPESLLALSPERLRACGLSRQKAAYVLDLAAKTAAGDVDFDGMARLDDGAVVRALTVVKGIGDWTAKMFLIFHLHRPDVLAHEDLGLRLAVKHFYGVPMARTANWMQRRHQAWSPYASVAARILWHARRAVMDEATGSRPASRATPAAAVRRVTRP